MTDRSIETIPASKGDVVRLHAKLDELSTSVTELKTTMTLTPAPKPRPCDDLKAHIQEHKDYTKGWRTSFVTSIVNFIFWLITVGLTAIAAAYYSKPQGKP